MRNPRDFHDETSDGPALGVPLTTRNLQVSEEERLGRAVEKAWCAYDNAAALSVRVSPSVPVLFFGDLDAYRQSHLRVLTVGLNPSRQEFPAGRPFLRFPFAEGPAGREPGRYLEALSSYYRTHPYRSWFGAFEPLLNGAGASYYAGHASTVLHTDICSPVAINPTWSQMGRCRPVSPSVRWRPPLAFAAQGTETTGCAPVRREASPGAHCVRAAGR